MPIRTKYSLLFLLAIVILSCKTKNENKALQAETTAKSETINFDHFNHLYKEIEFHNKTVGIVYIYSEYPNYEYEIESREGFTCVDDVARAIVLFSKYVATQQEDNDSLDKIKKMTEFVLEMQNENGYFNNFIWNDLSINTTYKTTVAEFNWWSLRALWSLETAYPLLKTDADLANRITTATQKLLENIKRDLPVTDFSTEMINGIETPTWLPQKHASDQAAILVLGLLKNYERTGDTEVKSIINAMAKGMIMMQKGDADHYPHAAFLSWENLWHAWGNNQAYALLRAGQVLDDRSFIDAALKEVNNFYPYLLKNGFAEAFWIQKTGENTYSEEKRNPFPQIAYGFRPMIWASIEAYKYSGEEKYAAQAKELALWFSGENIMNIPMYYPETGIVFDGINSPTHVNKNSGAESTIEGLLVQLEINKIK